jgi:hypothetical protein
VINTSTTNTDTPVKSQNNSCPITCSTSLLINTVSGAKQNEPLSETSDYKPSYKTSLVNQSISSIEDYKLAQPEFEQHVGRAPLSVQCTISSNNSKDMVISYPRTLEMRPTDTRTFNPAQHEVPSNIKCVDVSYGATEHSVQALVGRGTLDTLPDIKPVMISTTPSDPRLLSPSASLHVGNIDPVSGLSPLQLPSTVIQAIPISSSITQSSDVSSGTPGKKKVCDNMC